MGTWRGNMPVNVPSSPNVEQSSKEFCELGYVHEILKCTLNESSAESASEGSSGGSEANSDNSGQRHDSNTSQNGSGAHISQNGGTSTPHPMLNSMDVVPLSASGPPGGVPGPTTNLNIGMDYWGIVASPTVPVMQGNVSSVPVGGVVTATRDGVQSQLWLQVSFLRKAGSLINQRNRSGYFDKICLNGTSRRCLNNSDIMTSVCCKQCFFER